SVRHHGPQFEKKNGQPIGLAILRLGYGVEQYAECYRYETKCAAIDADAVVAGFDESLEARADRNLYTASYVPAKVVLRQSVAAADVHAGTVEPRATYCIRRKG